MMDASLCIPHRGDTIDNTTTSNFQCRPHKHQHQGHTHRMWLEYLTRGRTQRHCCGDMTLCMAYAPVSFPSRPEHIPSEGPRHPICENMQENCDRVASSSQLEFSRALPTFSGSRPSQSQPQPSSMRTAMRAGSAEWQRTCATRKPAYLTRQSLLYHNPLQIKASH
jgi:hypothetical protein